MIRYRPRSSVMFVVCCFAISIILPYSSQSQTGSDFSNQLAEFSGTNFRCDVKDYVSFGASRGCLIGAEGEATSVILLGNSHAQMYAPLVDELLKEAGLGGLVVPLNRCLPFDNVNVSSQCIKNAQINYDAVLSVDGLRGIIIGSTWYDDKYIDPAGESIDSRYLEAKAIHFITELKSHDLSIGMFSPISIPDIDLVSELPRKVAYGHISENDALQQLKSQRTIYDERFALLNKSMIDVLGDSNFIKVYNDLCDESFCYFGDSQTSFFSDDSHLSSLALSGLVNTKNDLKKFIQALSLSP